MTDIGHIKGLIEKKGKYGKADKEAIADACREYSVEVPANDACNNCWRDACIMVVNAAKQSQQQTQRNMLKGDTGKNGVIFKGRYVSNAVMTDELADWLRANGFPERWWI